MANRLANINPDRCVACGACIKICPCASLSVPRGIVATISEALCIGCGRCAKICPAGAIAVKEVETA